MGHKETRLFPDLFKNLLCPSCPGVSEDLAIFPMHFQKKPRQGAAPPAVEGLDATGSLPVWIYRVRRVPRLRRLQQWAPGWKGLLFPESGNAGRTILGMC